MAGARDARLCPADRDGCAPVDFYSTTNHETHVRLSGRWITVARQRMDALVVVEAEYAMFGTSLGVHLETGHAVEGGHHHHMRAINAIRRAGGIREAVEQKVLTSGIMHDCVRHGVGYVLAGSIRDDGPLPDTVMDLVEAQDRYAQALDGISMVLILSSMLHGIGVGNMLPSSVRTVCIDINPAVVTKLADRGSSQAAGIVTDTGLFPRQLVDRLTS